MAVSEYMHRNVIVSLLTTTISKEMLLRSGPPCEKT